MNQDLDISLLRTFVAIVDTGGLTSAGKKVGRTQPAITHQIKRLEGIVGRTLFGENRRQLVLTPDGEVLLEFARTMLRLNDEARGRFSMPGIAGHVTLGTPDLYAAYLLPDVLNNFARTHPNVEIHLRCTRSVYLSAALEREEIDIALMTNQPEFRRGELIRYEPVVWAASQSEAQERHRPLPLALMPQGSVYRQIAIDALNTANIPWTMRSICDSLAGLQAAVLAGVAVSVFPLCTITPNIRALNKSDGLPELAPIEMVLHRKEQGISEAAEQLARYIARELNNIPPPGET
ncbi:transcriptional regulator, LysR family [Afipia carboxidovorans OM5]|uniref:LysR substrate-binding domain-containing protein n=1 Tax=Afipia carboxidovorans TaxID=40137 RepID=UPI0001737537|nr:LysR substrate-binding domain-containing protein [Afipia carboxidovorans]ACI93854.1 transcriptional regulator, LysR family [Afipia carboxidovorans OM5]BEV46837.1 LysR substrate-binding domain-containing protein [Afipia carboxidovorans]